MKRNNAFWLFGCLQSLTLGVIIFLIFDSLNMITGNVGFDTQVLLSALFPTFLLIVEYQIFSKD